MSEPTATEGDVPDRLVGELAEFGSEDLASAGGKGANLGELVRAGFPVPSGFVITTAAYARLLKSSGLELTPLLDEDATGAKIRSAVSSSPVPDDLTRAVVAAYRRLGRGAVAVRSSATAEDLPGAAFAGQQDSYLNVVGEEALIGALRDCWASLWTERAVSYRRRQGIEPTEIAMAVVVQNMVAADVAGVMFSANPVTGQRDEIVVDASRGLGEAVVSGRVTPDHYVLDSRGRLRCWTAGGHEVEIRAVEGGGTSDLAGDAGSEPLLSDHQLRQLAALGSRVAAHFGRPQDIEWALAGAAVQLLQARPMTALPPEPLRLNFVQKTVGPFYVEMFQQRPYPLDVSGWIEHGIVTMLDRMAGSVGVAFPALSELLPEEDGVVLRLVPPTPRPTLKVLVAPLSIAHRIRRYDPSRWTHDERFTRFLAQVERVKSHNPQRLPWQALVSDGWELFAAMGHITDLRVSYLPASFAPQLPLRLMLLLLGRRRLASPLIAGAQTRTSQSNRELERLARQVSADAPLSQAFADLEPEELLRRLSADAAFAEFNLAFRAFLAEYGHRETVSVVLTSSPTWSDAPEVVLGLVKVLLTERVPSADQTGDALQELTKHPALGNRWLRGRVLAAVRRAKTGMAFREDSHSYATMVIPPLRRVLLEMGRRLTEAGVINDPPDVFHLRWEELAKLGEARELAEADRQRYRKLVRSRANKRQELAGFPLLDLNALFADRHTDADALLTGTGASGGTATATVRIVAGPAEFGTLRAGEVLVCPYTNPSWTPLFQRAVAVVVDTGGMGSHAAIVAREYGIPAVMGTRNATSTLVNGQCVTVDGTRGRVTAASGAS